MGGWCGGELHAQQQVQGSGRERERGTRHADNLNDFD